jgi:hypothetical protein
MDFFTLVWTILMGASGLYLGLISLLRGEITLPSSGPWGVKLYQRPSFLYYLLSLGFLLSSLSMISVSLLLYA